MAQGKKTVEDDDIYRAMVECDDPAFTTGELAKRFGMSSEGMRGRLEDLEEEGRIAKKKPSRRTVVWWAVDDQKSPVF